MTTYQTCRRHPEAGRFLAECYGCKRELFDMQARNAAEAAAYKAARTALTLIGTPDVQILSATRDGDTLTIATQQPGQYFDYAVDVFRLPTPAETDPDLTDDYRLTPGQWLLIWQAGDYDQAAVPGMLADARKHLTTTGLIPHTAHTTPTSPQPTVNSVTLTYLPSRPLLPTSQKQADQTATDALNALWGHAENCDTCLNAETVNSTSLHCRTGQPLSERAADTTTIANDWTRLNDWYRRGGLERHTANDWIAN